MARPRQYTTAEGGNTEERRGSATDRQRSKLDRMFKTKEDGRDGGGGLHEQDADSEAHCVKVMPGSRRLQQGNERHRSATGRQAKCFVGRVRCGKFRSQMAF